MRRLLACSALLGSTVAHPAVAQDAEWCDLACHSSAAADAAGEERYQEYLHHARAILALMPSHPGAVYALARGWALVGDTARAGRWLHRLAAMGDTRSISADPAFDSMRQTEVYAAVDRALRANTEPLLPGTVAVVLPDPDLVPEAFARDSARDRWLVGSQSQRKVIAIESDGTMTDFIDVPDMLRVVGIHADTERGLLWVATWAPVPDPAASANPAPSRTRLFKAGLASGRILGRYEPADSLGDHLFNDLVIAKNGDVYITDSGAGGLYRVQAEHDTLELFLALDTRRWSAANGIAISPDERMLWVAFFGGIARVDVESRSIDWLVVPDTISTAVIDGLYYVDRSLIGVQALPTMRRVVRYHLSRGGRTIVGAEVLERGDPLTSPSTGQVMDGRFYYIPNAQYERLADDGELTPHEGTPVLPTIRVVDLMEGSTPDGQTTTSSPGPGRSSPVSPRHRGGAWWRSAPPGQGLLRHPLTPHASATAP